MIQRIFSDHNWIRPQISDILTGKPPNIWILNTLINIPYVKDKPQGKLKSILN